MGNIWKERAAEWAKAKGPIVARRDIQEFCGVLCSRTMANIDSRGEGPARRIRVGERRVAYPLTELVEWLDRRTVTLDADGGVVELAVVE